MPDTDLQPALGGTRGGRAQTPGGRPARAGGSTSSHRWRDGSVRVCTWARVRGLAPEASMTRETHTLMVVHAHPDDEASSTGGLLRFAAEQGHTTIVVTCTQGDLGEVKMPGLRLHPRQDPADRQRLALIRQAELAHAALLLGVTHVYQLGYHDSGMAGWASNQERQAFVQASLEDVTGRLVPLIRRHRPDVVVTYDAHGGYGHPDHIMAHRVTMASVAAAAVADRFPQGGPPGRCARCMPWSGHSPSSVGRSR